MSAEPPRKDCRELLLSKSFLNACNTFYAVMPSSQENQEQPFVSKYLNIIDPLHAKNNLGRSVSKGNFFRIRSAFAFGAQRLVRLLDCPEENLTAEIEFFFRNTWDRHGKGQRPDVPNYNLYASNRNVSENSMCHEPEAEQTQASHLSNCANQKHANNLNKSKQMFVTSDLSSVSQTRSPKSNGILTNTVKKALFDKVQTPNYSSNEVHAVLHFGKDHPSPGLSLPPQHNHIGVSETVIEQSHSSASSIIDERKRSSSRSKAVDSHNGIVSAENERRTSYWICDDAVDSKTASNNYNGEFGLDVSKEDGHSVNKAMHIHQEEQGFVNITETFSNHSLGRYMQAPVNVNSSNAPFEVPPPVLASGYALANSFGTTPVIVPSFQSCWGQNMPYSQGLVPFSTLQWFPSVGVALNQEEITEPIDDNVVSAHLDHDDSDGDFCSEEDMNSVGGYECEDGNMQSQQQKDRKMVATVGSRSGNSSGLLSSGSCSSEDCESTIEPRWLDRENYTDDSHGETTLYTDVNSAASSKYTPASRSTSTTKLSSCSYSDGSPLKGSKLKVDQRVLKSVYPAAPSSVYKSQYGGKLVAQPENSSGDWLCQSSVGSDLAESTTAETVTSDVQTDGSASNSQGGPMTLSYSTVPDIPIRVGPGSSQRAINNHHLLYPAGPPDLFLTMFQLYSLPPEARAPYTATDSNYMDMNAEVGNLHACLSNASLDSTKSLKQSDTFHKSNHISHNVTSESFEKQRSDILNGDFVSCWLNLQYGRFCQNARLQGPSPYPPSVVPTMYVQGQFPWVGPGRPSANTNIMAHCPPTVPLMPIQHGSDRHVGINQNSSDGLPRYSGGTGPYLPNPVSYKQRYYHRIKHYSNDKYQKGNYNYDRKGHHGEMEGYWGFNSKPRFASRGQFHCQVERPGTRMDKIDPSNRRHDRLWSSFNHGSFPAGMSHSNPFNASMPNSHAASDIHPPPVITCTNVGSSQDGGPHSVTNEQAKFERDSAESSSDQPSSPEF